MNLQPTHLKLLAPDQLQITWSDGVQHVLTVRQLRTLCPCATCREQRQAENRQAEANRPPSLTVLSPAETEPLRFLAMRPVGHYAYAVAFSDGHDTGIFTLEFLRQLGEELAAS